MFQDGSPPQADDILKPVVQQPKDGIIFPFIWLDGARERKSSTKKVGEQPPTYFISSTVGQEPWLLTISTVQSALSEAAASDLLTSKVCEIINNSIEKVIDS